MITFHHFFMATAGAQSCGFSSSKSLHELQTAIQAPAPAIDLILPVKGQPAFLPGITAQTAKNKVPGTGVFLPRWSAEDLPFFCKIEHNWAKNRARIPVKFRLGSVEYVDWLEGKHTP